MIQPTAARGLAWIDPALFPGLAVPRAASADLREALAWRWLDDNAFARIDRQQIEPAPSASVRVHARIDPTSQRLIVDGQLSVDAGHRPLESVPLWIAQPEDLRQTWRFRDLAGAQIETEPIAEPERARLGFPQDGIARSLKVKIPNQTEKTIHFHAEYSWHNHGLIPLVALSRKFLSRGVVIVESPAAMQTRVQAVGVRRLDPSALEQARPDPGDEIAEVVRDDKAPPKTAVIDAYAFTGPGGRLELFTLPLAASEPAGIVREAILTTSVDPKGTSLNRLRLLVNLGAARTLDLVMPSGLSLVRVRRDGADVAPLESPSGLAIPLVGSGQGPKTSTIVVDYVAERGMVADGARLRPDLPRVGFPCLSFVWEVVTPPAWLAADCGPGLIAGDRQQLLDWPYAALGLPMPTWNFLPVRGRRHDDQVLRLLEDRLAGSVSAELTFAEMFSRWDSGPWPVVVDRIALGSAGWGPKSQCILATAKGLGQNVAVATLEQHGLALVPLPNVLVITTQAELPSLESRDRWADRFAEALVWGSDQTDRFQTVARWRGEPSPRLASTIEDEAPPGTKPPPGWSTWRFSAPGWPKSGSFVYIINISKRVVLGWVIASSCLLAFMACRSRLLRWRFVVLISVMALCLFAEWLLPSRYASSTAALYVAAFGLLVFELGRGFWPRLAPGRATPRSESSLVRRAAGAAVGVAFLAVSIGSVARAQPAAATGLGQAILALFPYDGPFDPTRPVTDVILRLADYKRLMRMADGEISRPLQSVRAVGALHRVTRKSAGDVVVESEIELTAQGHALFLGVSRYLRARHHGDSGRQTAPRLDRAGSSQGQDRYPATWEACTAPAPVGGHAR